MNSVSEVLTQLFRDMRRSASYTTAAEVSGPVATLGGSAFCSDISQFGTVRNVDIILDTHGGDTQQRSWEVLKRDGILVSMVPPLSAEEAAKRGVKAVMFVWPPNSGEFSEISKLVDSRKVKVFVETGLPLSEANRAHELSQTGHARGKIVLMVTYGSSRARIKSLLMEMR